MGVFDLIIFYVPDHLAFTRLVYIYLPLHWKIYFIADTFDAAVYWILNGDSVSFVDEILVGNSPYS